MDIHNMSNANAAAKKRRANMTPAQIQQQMQSSSPSVQSSDKQRQGLTLPQVISLVDARLTKLEDVVLKQQPNNATRSNTDILNTNDQENIKQILLEYEERFTMLVTQIHDLKEIVLKLQSYTMDVNKTLLEERMHFMNESNMESIETSIQTSSLKLDDLKLQEPEIVTSYVSNPIED
jgi:hypothetical protein